LGLKNSFYTTKDIHIHIPEGATPKDGPSAGITICAALISALTKIPTKADLALTGEITLQGRVLAVGGLKEKLLAAQQHKIKTLIVPHENQDDLQDILKEISVPEIQLMYVRTMDEVLTHAFAKTPVASKKQANKHARRTSSK
jgi:ATP-dependent Lon protease